MRRSFSASVALHAVVVLLAWLGLPLFARELPPQPRVVALEVVRVSERSAAPPAVLAPTPEKKPESAPPKPEAKPKPEPKPQPEPKAEQKPAPAPKPRAEAKPTPEPAKAAEAPEPKAEPKAEPPKAPEPEPVAMTEPEPKPEPKPESKPEATPKAKAPPPPAKKPAAPVKEPAKAESKPAPKKPKATPSPPSDFARLLKDLSERKAASPTTADEPPLEQQVAALPDTSPVTGQDSVAQVTMSEIDVVRRQIERCWRVPAGARDAEDLVVRIRVHMNQDGTPASAEILDRARMAQDPPYRTAAESAQRAVLNHRCHPFKLPPEKYEYWQTMTLVFDPKEMLGP